MQQVIDGEKLVACCRYPKTYENFWFLLEKKIMIFFCIIISCCKYIRTTWTLPWCWFFHHHHYFKISFIHAFFCRKFYSMARVYIHHFLNDFSRFFCFVLMWKIRLHDKPLSILCFFWVFTRPIFFPIVFHRVLMWSSLNHDESTICMTFFVHLFFCRWIWFYFIFA